MTATLVRSTLSCKKEKAEEPVPKRRCRRSLIREEKVKERSSKPPRSALCKGCRVQFSPPVQGNPASLACTREKKEKRGTKKSRGGRLWLCTDPACPRRDSCNKD